MYVVQRRWRHFTFLYYGKGEGEGGGEVEGKGLSCAMTSSILLCHRYRVG